MQTDDSALLAYGMQMRKVISSSSDHPQSTPAQSHDEGYNDISFTRELFWNNNCQYQQDNVVPNGQENSSEWPSWAQATVSIIHLSYIWRLYSGLRLFVVAHVSYFESRPVFRVELYTFLYTTGDIIQNVCSRVKSN